MAIVKRYSCCSKPIVSIGHKYVNIREIFKSRELSSRLNKGFYKKWLLDNLNGHLEKLMS